MVAVYSRRLKLKLFLLFLLRRLRRNHERYKKKFWVRQIFQQRHSKGEFHLLVNELKLFDHELFFVCFRMSPITFEKLLSWVAPYIAKQTTRFREPVYPNERLAVTLRYLATGDAKSTIALSYRMSPTTVGRIVEETSRVLWMLLLEKNYLSVPNSQSAWKIIAKDFEEKWNFPHCLGAIDGKHVVMQAPSRSGSEFYNYKRTHSIVLLATCDANYKFVLVDVGDAGRQSDAGVYTNSKLGFAIENQRLNLPLPEMIDGTQYNFPFVFVADDAFSLKQHMLKPYPCHNLEEDKRVFNYRLSRARRVIENTFGIAAARFRIFRRPIIGKVDTVISITKAVVALHNFLMSLDENERYCPSNFVDRNQEVGLWREEAQSCEGLVDFQIHGSNNYSKEAKKVRDDFKDYFCKEGTLSWQWQIIRSTAKDLIWNEMYISRNVIN